MYFQVLTQLGAVPIPVETKEMDQGAVTRRISRRVATHLSDLLIVGAERDKTPKLRIHQ